MFRSKCMFLCFCYVMLGCHASLAPFITKCVWNDKDCLVKSSQACVSVFAAGLPEFDMSPLDPLTLDPVVYHEGGLKINFNDMTMTGSGKCKVLEVERDLEESSIEITADCPIFVKGTYIGSGNLFTKPFEGSGPFTVKIDKMHFTVKVYLTTVDGKDGQKHWQLGKTEHIYEPIGEVLLDFQNLYNGDPEKAEDAEALGGIIHQNSEALTKTAGDPIVAEVLKKILFIIQKFFFAVPASELEK